MRNPEKRYRCGIKCDLMMKADVNKEALELLALLEGWRSQGQLVYELRELGIGWAAIKAVCPYCESSGNRWAKTRNKPWPVEVEG